MLLVKNLIFFTFYKYYNKIFYKNQKSAAALGLLFKRTIAFFYEF